LGNHDAAVTGHIPLDAFNMEAQRSVLWMREKITADNLQFLSDLPETQIKGDVTLVHGSPRNPIWEYILDAPVARTNFGYFDTQFCFVGHTHLPLRYSLQEDGMIWSILHSNDRIEFNGRSIINPGSVGQPRDRDARASYALFDPEDNIWESRRTTYDIDAVKERIREAGLPMRNAHRLSGGW
jgi:diadenosine tetraphosphatase ApaH/serine/threonine PP2A family protein phosphatase